MKSQNNRKKEEFSIILKKVDIMIVQKNGLLLKVKKNSHGCLVLSKIIQAKIALRKSMNLFKIKINLLKRLWLINIWIDSNNMKGGLKKIKRDRWY